MRLNGGMTLTSSPAADTMREAAALMRRERGAHEFYRAVADWLDDFATEIDAGHYWRDAAALTVANTYLGGSNG
jgi:hypothetical protein